MYFLGDDTAQDRNRKVQEHSKKLQLSSSIMEDLREEYLDTPIEITQSGRAQQILTKQEQERQNYEEEYLTRLPINKKEKHLRRKLITLGTLGDEITDFGGVSSKSNNNNNKKRKLTRKSKGKSFKRKRY